MLARAFPLAVLLLIAVAAGLGGGGDLAFDRAVVRSFIGWRMNHPEATSVVIFLTYLGGAPVLIVAGITAAAATALRDRTAAAAALFATALGGRVLIELIKWLVARPRPALDAHPVSVFSQSFPSAHAGNTAITYGAIVLFALPERWRASGLATAVALSGSIGATRPILGVHWPSDVVGGWALGALWLLVCWTVWQRVRPRQP